MTNASGSRKAINAEGTLAQTPLSNALVYIRNKRLTGVLFALLLAAAVSVSAQFGHPLKGQWSGQWGPKDSPSRLLLDIEWDGKDLTGKINPGTETEGTLKKVTIDYSPVDSWKVQMEGEAKDGGKVVPVRVDGTLENLGAYYKVFHGTWTQGGRKGDFTVTRN